jgi:hypothetical protein
MTRHAPPRGYRGQLSEKAFQQSVVDLARLLGWRVYHTHDSRKSEPGFPDLVLAHPNRGVLFRELKTNTGILSPSQAEFITVLQMAGADAATWRPMDWDRIERELGAMREAA